MHFILAAEGLQEWMEQFAHQYGYFGVFLISLIGSLSIVFPVPYTLIIYLVGTFLDPLSIAIAGGLGSALGEVSGYILGYYGRAVVSEERQKKMDFMLRMFSRYGTPAIFIFALTPLPDDLLFIPLGIMRYRFIKAFIPCVLGKFSMCLVLAIGGRLSIGFVRDLFGGGGWWTTLATTVILIVIVAIILRVDWEKLFIKYAERHGNRSKD